MKLSALGLASIIILLLSCGILYPAPANSREDLPSAAMQNSSPGPDTGVIRHVEGFDLQSCETNCRSIYGIRPYVEELQAGGGAASGSYGRYLLIAQCIEQCNKRFWKEFDEKMRDLDRPVH